LPKNGLVMAEPFFGFDESLGQMLKIICTDVFEFAPFEHIPYALLR
jgi:hypothetical protein